MLRRRPHLSAALLAALLAACGSSETNPSSTTGGNGGAGGSGGGDSQDPAHCAFEAPPAFTPKAAESPSAVRAGYGAAVLAMPIGTPMGGYGTRLLALGQGEPPDARARRFATAFAPSVGLADAPRAEAIAIEAGEEKVVLLRVDAPLINENAVFDLESAVAPDGSMRGRILVTASHSHAGWGAWQPSYVLMVGIDKPRRELEQRMVAGMAAAVKAALAALEPAKIGVAVEANFDPKDEVTRDRRKENDSIVGPDGNTAGKGKDPIVWALRVDRADGSPLAAIVNLPIHGTVGTELNPLVSSDAPGAVGRALSAELGYPVLHLQGAAGDVSPSGPTGREACPDAVRCLDLPRLEIVGARAAAQLAPLVKGISTGEKAALEVVTRSFYNGREAKVTRPDGSVLEYAPVDREKDPDGVIFDAQGKIVSPIDEFNTAAGAGLCGNSEGGSITPIPGTYGVGAYSSCLDITTGKDIIFGFFDVPANRPMPLCDTVRATAAALRIAGTPSGDWLLLGVPGEPTAPYAAYLRSRSPAGAEHTLLVGYADEYAGYMLTAEDWLAGGYEPSTNVWGPLEGEIVLQGVIDAGEIAWTPEREDPEAGSSRFVDFDYPESAPVQTIVTSDHGTKVTTAPEGLFWPDTIDPNTPLFTPTAPRAVGAARFTWYGGDPAIDFPEVVIEREVAPDQFEPLAGIHGSPASAAGGAVVLTYTPSPLADPAPAQHVYAAVWQPVPAVPYSLAGAQPFSLPLGRYRFKVSGRALGGGGEVTYSLTSDPIEIVAAPLAPESTAAVSGEGIAIHAVLGGAPGLRALRERWSDKDVPLGGPWAVKMSFADQSEKSAMVTPDAEGNGALPLSAEELGNVTAVEVLDPAGNGGTLPVQK